MVISGPVYAPSFLMGEWVYINRSIGTYVCTHLCTHVLTHASMCTMMCIDEKVQNLITRLFHNMQVLFKFFQISKTFYVGIFH